MRIFFACFSDVKFLHFRKRLCRQASAVFDGVLEYDHDEFLTKTDFFSKNKKLLVNSQALRNGCLWKPYIILDALNQVAPGDVVFYMDCGCSFKKDVVGFLKDHFLKHDTLLLNGIHTNKYWTKYDCFHLMNCDTEEYKNAIQLAAAIIGFKKTDDIMRFVREWLHYCKDENVATNIPSIHGHNDPCFMEHRGDQSVLTNLKIKHGFHSCPAGHKIWSLVASHVNRIVTNDKVKELGYSHNVLFGGSRC